MQSFVFTFLSHKNEMLSLYFCFMSLLYLANWTIVFLWSRSGFMFEWDSLMNLVIQYRSKVSWHSKLEPRDSILEPRCSKGSRIESRGSRNRAFSNMQNSKGFRGNDLFLEGRIVQYCSHLKYKCFASTCCLAERSFCSWPFCARCDGLIVKET